MHTTESDSDPESSGDELDNQGENRNFSRRHRDELVQREEANKQMTSPTSNKHLDLESRLVNPTAYFKVLDRSEKFT